MKDNETWNQQIKKIAGLWDDATAEEIRKIIAEGKKIDHESWDVKIIVV